MKDEPRPVHQLEHAEPTVIHHPDQDMTILARWLHRGMEQGSRFWVMLGGSVLAIGALAVVVSGLAAGKSTEGTAWAELLPAKTAEDRLKVAEAHPRTPVAVWAKLQAGFEEYANGIDDLTTPGKRESAGPRLKKALDLFQQVVEEAPKDSPHARGAAFAIARTLEARNELPEAIKQYRMVAETWPGDPEAKQSEALIRTLGDPDTAAFYRELYAFKPPTGAGSPNPGVSPSPRFPGMSPGFGTPPGRGSRSIPEDIMKGAPRDLDPPPANGPVPAPSTSPGPVIEAAPAAPKAELPADPFSPPG